MKTILLLDSSDPRSRAYRKLRRTVRNLLIVLIALSIMVIGWGIPSIQYTYRAYPTSGTPTAHDKLDADYWTPGFGWRVIRATDRHGCPIITFVPLSDCVDLSPYENWFTSLLFSEEFFDEPTN